MQSQLDPEDNLHDDERQAQNVCFEANMGPEGQARRVRPKKDAATQTFNGISTSFIFLTSMSKINYWRIL